MEAVENGTILNSILFVNVLFKMYNILQASAKLQCPHFKYIYNVISQQYLFEIGIHRQLRILLSLAMHITTTNVGPEPRSLFVWNI